MTPKDRYSIAIIIADDDSVLLRFFKNYQLIETESYRYYVDFDSSGWRRRVDEWLLLGKEVTDGN